MTLFVFNLEWPSDELDVPTVTEWTLSGVLCPQDIESHLMSEFGCQPVCFEYYEL